MHKMFLVSLWLLASAWPAHAQPQDKAAQSCINKLNQDGAAVALQQGKESLACLTTAGKGKLDGSVDACLTADAKRKVAGKQQKTVGDDAAKCTIAPGFAYAGAAAVNDAAVSGELGIVADLLGAPLDAAVVGCAADAEACRCQQQVAKSAQILAAAQRNAFVKCTKDALQVRKLPFPAGASSAADLAACVDDASIPTSIAGGGKGAIPRQSAKLADAIAKKCDAPGVTAAAFDDGRCAGKTGAALVECIESLVACRVCQTVKDMDALPLACDACAALHGSVTFTSTATLHGFTVPMGVTRVTIQATGAQGGNGGGRGGVVTATIAVTSGETLTVAVGGEGDWFGPAGANGGGVGGFRAGDSYLGVGGGGGGASDVRQGGVALENRVVVAAGGGGGMGGNLGIHGGDGGGLVGQPGLGTPGWFGGGASQSEGGAGGAVATIPNCAGQSGALGVGGNGAFWIGQPSLCANYGGGAGGGGYYGGGGAGASGSDGGGGGGGGSSYAAPAAIDVVFGPATGEAGSVVISW
jgi:hypothetical protein